MKGDVRLKLGNISSELIFVILALMHGSAFLLVTHLFQVLAEDAHF